MPKKGSKEKPSPDGLWIAPKYSLKGPAGERAWEMNENFENHQNWLIWPD
jgi:hypothetical protein